MTSERESGGCSEGLLVTFGVLLPIVAFFFDASMQINPVLWGDTFWVPGRPGPGVVGARHVVVYTLLAVSLVGALASIFGPRTSRTKNALAIGCLTVAFGFAGLHALVFLPLAPFMAVAMLVGVGFIGMSPYFALATWTWALWRAVDDQAAIARPRWVIGPVVVGVVVLVLAAAPFLVAHARVQEMRTGGPRAVSRGFRELGCLVSLARHDLAALYPDLDGPSQVRLRNLYIEEFGVDANAEALRGRGWR